MDTQLTSRRNFLKVSGLTGALLSLGFYVPAEADDVEIVKAAEAGSFGVEMNAGLHIDTAGKVT